MKKPPSSKRRGRPRTKVKPAVKLSKGGQPATWHDEGSWAFIELAFWLRRHWPDGPKRRIASAAVWWGSGVRFTIEKDPDNPAKWRGLAFAEDLKRYLNKATWASRIKAVERGLNLSRYKDKGPLPTFPFPHVAFIRTGAGFVEGTMETAFSHLGIQSALDLFAFAGEDNDFAAWCGLIRERFAKAGFPRAADFLLADLTSIPSKDERIHLMGRITGPGTFQPQPIKA
ncbi:hypothetical protein [Phreatobacter oligotrophus]|uniref:Uncharacterized protein n=1 Tax=Phreatobacter oligotrophus TaxID=1122261 RepID=A0A2T4YY92_9HYPH|nr:hypothetical protein [Phreatobacter oligotrophus]PTM51472.1 hypothetical protein C8P69_110138 [Phreatobacter oligotrophus]